MSYPTYDEWLKEQGLSEDTIPTAIGVSNIDENYIDYFEYPEDAVNNPLYAAYKDQPVYVYGTINKEQDLHIHGPSEWHHWYRNFHQLKQQSRSIFTNTLKFRNIMKSFGYTLGDIIAIGDDGSYDNQIWRVSKGGAEQNIPVVNYACKIIHIRNYEDRGLPNAGRQLLKEATILMTANHESVIRVFDNLFIEDSETLFPYLFVASVMELMSGSVDRLIRNSTGSVLPEEQCFWCLHDCAHGINYLHNEMRGPGGQWMRVVHMAIRTANILYIFDATANRNRFKLADFEECIVYDRHFRPELWNPDDPDDFPPDVLPDFNQDIYTLQMSAPEISAEGDRSNLHLMPNDVFCLGTSIAFCIVNDGSQNLARVTSMFQMIEQYQLNPPAQNTLQNVIMCACCPNPNERPTIEEILSHPYLNTVHQF